MRRLWQTHSPSKPPKRSDDDHVPPNKLDALPLAKPPPPPPSPEPPLVLDHVAEKARRVELIVKLGGSALTIKSRPHTLHHARFTAAMDTMAALYRRGHGFILIHGAGSFGHFEAHQYHVSAGDASPLGVAATHAAVVHLNRLVVDALVKRGIPAVGVSPLLVPAKVRNDFVATLLDRGHLPVLHGDACYAGDGRTAILSGDALVASLCNSFEFVNRIVFLSDVPGVLSRPPEHPKDLATVDSLSGDLIRRVTVNELGEITFDADMRASKHAHDVTGGITAKVAAAGRCVAHHQGRVTAFIAGVGSTGAEDALLARPERWGAVRCTRICYEVQGVSSVDGTAIEESSGSSRRRGWFGHGGGGLSS